MRPTPFRYVSGLYLSTDRQRLVLSYGVGDRGAMRTAVSLAPDCLRVITSECAAVSLEPAIDRLIASESV
jgi:hypothetical protein